MIFENSLLPLPGILRSHVFHFPYLAAFLCTLCMHTIFCFVFLAIFFFCSLCFFPRYIFITHHELFLQGGLRGVLLLLSFSVTGFFFFSHGLGYLGGRGEIWGSFVVQLFFIGLIWLIWLEYSSFFLFIMSGEPWLRLLLQTFFFLLAFVSNTMTCGLS